MADNFVWASSVTGGAWNNGANWADETTPGSDRAPGALDAATVVGGAGTNFQIVTGPGAAATGQFTGNTALEGSFAIAGLVVGSTISSLAAGSTDFEFGSTLTAGTSVRLIGDMELDGTSTLLQTPLLQQTGPLIVVNGARVQANTATIAGLLAIDPLGTVEIGGLGTGGPGSLTVDAGATLTLGSEADILAGISLGGSLLAAAGGSEFVSGSIVGTGTLEVGSDADMTVSDGIGGLASVQVDADAVFYDYGTLSGVGTLSIGGGANADFGNLSGIGSISVGNSAALAVDSVTASGAITLGSNSLLEVTGTLSGVVNITVGVSSEVVFFGGFGSLATAGDQNVPISLGGHDTLVLSSGASLLGNISGFDSTDLFADYSLPVTGASFVAGGAGGTLTLSDDGVVTSEIALAGAYAGDQFLTNLVGLSALPLAYQTDSTVVLAAGTISAIAASGTVTGAQGAAFDILGGVIGPVPQTLTFRDNLALESSLVTTQATIVAGDTATFNALDIESGGTLDAVANAVIDSNAEVDGAAAALLAGRTLVVGTAAELAVANGGAVQAQALSLLGTAGGAGGTISLDSTGLFEVGTLADALVGTLVIDSGATVTATGGDYFTPSEIAGQVANRGAIVFNDARLEIEGSLTGAGLLNLGSLSSLEVVGDLTGFTGLTDGASTSIDVDDNLVTGIALTLATSSDLSVGGGLTAAGLTASADADIAVGGDAPSTVGPITLGSLAVASFIGNLAASGAGQVITLGTVSQLAVDGTLSGYAGVTLAPGATLTLESSETVPVTLLDTGTAAQALRIATGMTVGGAVSGLVAGDAIDLVASDTYDGIGVAPTLVTGAILSAGLLTLTSDGTATDIVAVSGLGAATQFLTNAMDLPYGDSAEVLIPAATLTSLGTGGTVTGGNGTTFDVLAGGGTAATIAVNGNIGLEGSYTATGTAAIGSTLSPFAVLDIEAGATLAAATGLVNSYAEVDGSGAALLATGTLTVGGDLLAVNGGRVQSSRLVLGTTAAGDGTIAVDPAGVIEVGSTGIGAAGTVTIDASQTLAASGTISNVIDAPVTDDGTLLSSPGTFGTTEVAGTLSGTGSLAVATGDFTASAIAGLASVALGTGTRTTVTGNVAGVGAIGVAPTASLFIAGNYTSAGNLSIGAGASVEIEGSVSGTGTIFIGAGGDLELSGSESGVTIAMSAGATLSIDAYEPVTGVIEGFATTDLISVLGGSQSFITEADDVGGSLLLSDDGTYTNTLSLAGSFGTQQFLTNILPGQYATDITLATPCFARGTRIATARGEVAVEALRPGDRVLLAAGDSRPIEWIGHRRVACTRHPRPAEVWPVRVRKGAFGAGLPVRDLWLSPDHAVFADEVLVPIKHLVNERSIAQVETDSVEYWHVELDRHDVLLAEGLPAESYLDTGNRTAFANGGAHVALHPDFAARSWDEACAELVQGGPRLTAIKRRLFARAGITERAPAPVLRVMADGLALAPAIDGPQRWRFALPPGVRSLHLLSDPWTPASQLAGSLDRRRLGARLLGVAIGGQAIALDGPALFSGFHPPETTGEGPCRWTDGDARIVVPPGTATVELHVGPEVAAPRRRRRAA